MDKQGQFSKLHHGHKMNYGNCDEQTTQSYSVFELFLSRIHAGLLFPVAKNKE